MIAKLICWWKGHVWKTCSIESHAGGTLIRNACIRCQKDKFV